MKYEHSKRFGKILVLIGECVPGNKIRDFLPFLFYIERFPRYVIENIGRIGEVSFFQVKNIDDVTEFVNENFYLFGIARYNRRENEFISHNLPSRLLSLRIQNKFERSDFRSEMGRIYDLFQPIHQGSIDFHILGMECDGQD